MADQASSVKARSWPVPADLRDIRLDAFVRRCLPHLSRRAVEIAVRDKLFSVNGKAGKKGQKLMAHDVLTFSGSDEWLVIHPLPQPELGVPIVYEDSSLLVVDKPAGMPTHGFSGCDLDTLANVLVARRPELAGLGNSRWESGLVHRLDGETSGLVLAAKTQNSFEQLRLQFRRRRITKKYRALVWGITESAGSVSYPIAHNSRDKTRMRAIVDASIRARTHRSWRALTRFRKLADAHGLSLLDIEMETGVTHQIRVHLAAIGHPIVGDVLYGAHRKESFGLKRHFLHASSLEFFHPDDGRMLKVESGLPGELQELLKRLKVTL